MRSVSLICDSNGERGMATGEDEAKAIVRDFDGVVVGSFGGGHEATCTNDSIFSSKRFLRRIRSMALWRGSG